MNDDLTSLTSKLTAIQETLHNQPSPCGPGPTSLWNPDHFPALFFRISHSKSQRVEFLNDLLEELTGYTRDELLHSETAVLYPIIFIDDRPRATERSVLALDEAVPYEVEYRILHKDKTVRYILERGKPCLDEQGCACVQGIILDITERKTSELAHLKPSGMDVTATLAGGIAHDLNNLMVGVLGNSYFLKTEYQRHRNTVEIIDEIIDAGKRASVLIYQLLAYSRVGRFEQKMLDINNIVGEIIQLQHYMVPGSVTLEYHPQRLPGKVQGDINQFSQVIMSLLSNAIEAIETSGKITVATAPATPQECSQLNQDIYARITVTDTGRGMSSEVQTKIFEPFFTTKFPGRGLGLAAASSIIKSHRGHIFAESKEGRGSKFTIYLPLKVASSIEETSAIEDQSLIGITTLT